MGLETLFQRPRLNKRKNVTWKIHKFKNTTFKQQTEIDNVTQKGSENSSENRTWKVLQSVFTSSESENVTQLANE